MYMSETGSINNLLSYLYLLFAKYNCILFNSKCCFPLGIPSDDSETHYTELTSPAYAVKLLDPGKVFCRQQ